MIKVIEANDRAIAEIGLHEVQRQHRRRVEVALDVDHGGLASAQFLMGRLVQRAMVVARDEFILMLSDAVAR